jgi:hypothetical protein
MPEILEAVSNVMKTLIDDEPKPPLNTVEVSDCWLYLAFLENAVGPSQIALNTTTDEELSSALHEELNLIEMQLKELKQFMINEGVPLPTASVQKPKCESNEIPPGAKHTDQEIANELSLKIATATVSCASIAAQSIRNDVALMFTRFLGQKLTYGSNLKTLMRNRGWILIPPSYVPPGLPHETH